MKRFFEWYLDIPPPAPGQGTAWSVEFHPPWPNWLPLWAVALLAAAAVVFIVSIYLRESATVSARMRCLLAGMRLTTVALVLLFLSGLTLAVERTGLPILGVMIDDSASMGLEDEYDARDVRNLVGGGGSSGKRSLVRLELARNLLLRQDARFLKQLQRRHKLHIYRFSESAGSLGQSESGDAADMKPLAEAIAALQANGEKTRPGSALKQVLEDLRGTPPAALVLFTDGIASTSDADRLSASAPEALRRLVPLYVVALGSPVPTRDLELFDLLASEVAFVDEPLSFTAKLKGFGLAGEEARVTLTRKGDSQILAESTVEVPADGKPTRVELIYTPEAEGEFDFLLSAEPSAPQTGRESDMSNNSDLRHVSVRNQKIRVLLADAAPRYEFRFLKHLLERNKTVQVDTFLQQADLEFAAEDETALAHFPVKRDDIFQYDVVILGDIDPEQLSQGALTSLRDFVRDGGGGIIFIAGERANPIAYRGTPLEPVIPVELEDAELPTPDSLLQDGFRPQLTVEAQRGTALFRFVDDAAENTRIFNQLQPLHWLLAAPTLKSGAIAFAEHPTRTGNDGRLPVIAMQRYGAGKVLFHATDELWLWRFRTGDRYYGRYWIHAIRFLARSRLLGQSRTAELTTDRIVYERGDGVLVRLTFLDERLVPPADTDVTVVVERSGRDRQTVKLARVQESPAIFEGHLSHVQAGSYHAWVASPAFAESPPSTNFRVEAPLEELQKRATDLKDLQRAARSTHGKVYTIATADRIPDEVPAGFPVPLDSEAPIPLWNRWELLILFSVLLVGEWLLRKRARLV